MYSCIDKGGFDATVGKHTQLDGAVITSTATSDKNHLDTGTFGFNDLHNEADYKVSHSGGGSFGGGQFKGNMPVATAVMRKAQPRRLSNTVLTTITT